MRAPCVNCSHYVTVDRACAPVVCAGCAFWTVLLPRLLFVDWQKRDVYTLLDPERLTLPDAQMMTATQTSGGKIVSDRFVCLGVAPDNANLDGVQHVLLEYTPDALPGVY